MEKSKEVFIFVCPKCESEFDFQFTDEELELSEGLPAEIDAARCESCGAWIKPVKKN